MNAPLNIDTIYEDRELRLRWLPGTSRTMVVAFTGRHHQFGGQPADEFARSAHGKGHNSVLFVSDLHQSWYSRPGLWQRIVRMVREVRNAEKIDEVVTLGNSMGGFGALLLPRDLKVRRALGFCAQVSMDRNVIDEDRWMTAQRRFGQLPVRNVAETIDAGRTHYFLTAGTAAPKDVAQLGLMPDHPRVHSWVLPGAGHNLAERLKKADLLHKVIAAMIRGKRAAIEALYSDYTAWHEAGLIRAATSQEGPNP